MDWRSRLARSALTRNDRREVAARALAVAAKGEEALRLAARAAGDVLYRRGRHAEHREFGAQDRRQIDVRLGAAAVDHVRIGRARTQLQRDLVADLEAAAADVREQRDAQRARGAALIEQPAHA